MQRPFLNRREVVNQGAGLGLEAPTAGGLHPTSDGGNVDSVDVQEEVVEVEDEEMGVPPQATDDVVAPTPTEAAAMDVDEPEPRQQSHLGSRQKHIRGRPSGTPEPGHDGSMGPGATASSHLSPDPVPKKARGPMGETRPLAIVLPNGEALWFTTRDIDNMSTRRGWLYPGLCSSI